MDKAGADVLVVIHIGITRADTPPRYTERKNIMERYGLKDYCFKFFINSIGLTNIHLAVSL